MGLLDEFGIDTEAIPEAPSFDIEDGWYDWTIGDVFVKNGSTKNPDAKWLIFEYLIGDSGQKFGEFFTLPVDGENPTTAELDKLSWYKARIVSLGFAPEEVNGVDREDLIGLTGTFQLLSTPGKGANRGTMYQNIKNLKVSEEAPEEEAPAPVVKKTRAPAATAPAVKQTAPANPFSK